MADRRRSPAPKPKPQPGTQATVSLEQSCD